MTTDEIIKILKKKKKDVEKATEKINKALEKQVRKDVEQDIIKKSIQEFYDDYKPRGKKGGYKRKKDLFNAYKFTRINGNKFLFETGAQFMKKKHRASNEYIYNLSFVSGWHGGAISIKDSKVGQWGAHPKPGFWTPGDNPITEGIPWWRTPPIPNEELGIKRWQFWGDHSEKSDAPLSQINRLLDDYEKKLDDIKQDLCDKEIFKILTE